MDSEHRHELKENDLARFITGLSAWWKDHGRNTMIILLVGLLVVFGWKIWNFRSQQTHEQTWAELLTTSNPDVFRSRAASYSNPAAAALANLWGAARYNARASLPGASSDRTSAERTADLDHAETMLASVIDDDATPQIVRLNAMMFKAAVKENRGEFDAAERIYKQVQEGSKAKGYEAWGRRAQARMDLLANYANPVVFGPEPVKTEPDLDLSTDVLPDANGATTLPPELAPTTPPATPPADALPSPNAGETDRDS